MSLFVKDERLSSPIQPATRKDRLGADGWTECSHCEGTGGIDHGGGMTPWDGPADIEPCGCAYGLVPPEGMVEAAAASIQRDLRPVSDDFGLFQLVARAALIAVARWEATDDGVPLEAEEREWCATHDEPIVMRFIKEAGSRLLKAGGVWWCEAHVSNGPKENGEHGPCWFIHFADAMRRHAGSTTKHGPCRMVPAKLLVDPQEGESE